MNEPVTALDVYSALMIELHLDERLAEVQLKASQEAKQVTARGAAQAMSLPEEERLRAMFEVVLDRFRIRNDAAAQHGVWPAGDDLGRASWRLINLGKQATKEAK
jgi:hypothetical protein